MKWMIAIGIGIHTGNGMAIIGRAIGLPHWGQGAILVAGIIAGTWMIISGVEITEKSA